MENPFRRPRPLTNVTCGTVVEMHFITVSIIENEIVPITYNIIVLHFCSDDLAEC